MELIPVSYPVGAEYYHLGIGGGRAAVGETGHMQIKLKQT